MFGCLERTQCQDLSNAWRYNYLRFDNMDDELIVGQAYYRVTYADPRYTIPGVEPMIYLGQNVFDDDSNDSVTHYFQRPSDWNAYGNVLDSPVETAQAFGILTERNRDDILNLNQVIELMKLARTRGEE